MECGMSHRLRAAFPLMTCKVVDLEVKVMEMVILIIGCLPGATLCLTDNHTTAAAGATFLHLMGVGQENMDHRIQTGVNRCLPWVHLSFICIRITGLLVDVETSMKVVVEVPFTLKVKRMNFMRTMEGLMIVVGCYYFLLHDEHYRIRDKSRNRYARRA